MKERDDIEVFEGRSARTEVVFEEDIFPDLDSSDGSSKTIPSAGRKKLLAAAKVFDVLLILVPHHIAEETIHRSMEDLAFRVVKRRPNWEINTKIVMTVFWVGVAALRELRRSLSGKS